MKGPAESGKICSVGRRKIANRRFLSTLSRSMVWLDRGQTRRLERGFAHFEEWRDAMLAEEERDQHKLARRIVAEASDDDRGLRGVCRILLMRAMAKRRKAIMPNVMYAPERKIR
jgi:ATPase subunit of ABC transporter with duplicated ATPase domains